MPSGRYFYYQLQPSSSDLAFLDSLTISLESVLGDADLLVSTTRILPKIDEINGINETGIMISRQNGRWDTITLQRQENYTLNRPIYIGVYS